MILQVTILSDQCAVVGGILLPPLPLSYPEKEIGKSKEEIGNLNGFKCMHFTDLKVPYF
jgi:hypothetical protein